MKLTKFTKKEKAYLGIATLSLALLGSLLPGQSAAATNLADNEADQVVVTNHPTLNRRQLTTAKVKQVDPVVKKTITPAVQRSKPVINRHFGKNHPASLSPVVTWEKYLHAVVYEIEVFADNKLLAQDNHIYVNGYNIVLPSTFHGDKFTWHVRALNLDRQPISSYSAMETVYVDRSLPVVRGPEPTNKFNETRGANLLYPVYNWIPMNSVRNYEVEVLSALPDDDEQAASADILLGKGHAQGFDWYDDDKRVSTEPMYWRVRGIDENGQPLSHFSQPQKFVTNPDIHFQVATFGDSITHGGGSLSYSPSDWEYSYQSYLDFDTLNLGQSGDTSASSLARFDEDVVPFHPDYLIIMTGSNSLRGGTAPESVINDLKAIQAKCLANDIKPILMTLPPINPDNIKRAFDEPTINDWPKAFAEVNEFIRTQIHIDLGNKFNERKALPTALGLDGIHLDIPGKQLMAEAINEQLPKILTQDGQKLQ